MKIRLSKSQWEAVGKKAGWMRTAIVPTLAPPGIKGKPVNTPPTAFQNPNAKKVDPNPFNQNDAKTRKEVSDYVRWLGPKVNDRQLQDLIQQNQGAKKGVMEFTEALTNVPVSKTKEIVQKTEDVKETLEEEQNQTIDGNGKSPQGSVKK